MLDKLVKIAIRLDQLGETKLADEVDAIVQKLAQSKLFVGMKKDGEILEMGTHIVQPGDTLSQITLDRKGGFEVSVSDNLALNPGLKPELLMPGMKIKVWQSSEIESGTHVEGMEPLSAEEMSR